MLGLMEFHLLWHKIQKYLVRSDEFGLRLNIIMP